MQSHYPHSMYTVGYQIPTLHHDVHVTALITHNGVHSDMFTNYTSLGSEIQLLCKNGTNQEGANAVFRSVCQENGLWSPDLSEHIILCTDQSSEFNNNNYYYHASSSVIDFQSLIIAHDILYVNMQCHVKL